MTASACSARCSTLFSHPGRIVAPPQAPTGVGPLSHAATAFVPARVDRDTPPWLAPAFDLAAVRDFVRFHTGAPIATREADALFAMLAPGRTPLLGGFAIGSDPYPDRSATLVIEVPSPFTVVQNGSTFTPVTTARA